jgi:hypothetical protein
MIIALTAGTSGMVGMQILHQLLQHSDYDFVVSVGRRKLALKHNKLIQLEGDLAKIDAWDWEQKLTSQSLGGEFNQLRDAIVAKSTTLHAFCSLGTTIKQAGSKEQFHFVDHDLVIAFAVWAKKIGAQKFFYVSSTGADENSSFYYSEVKGEVEKDLNTLDFNYLGIFRPSLLMGNRSEFRFGESAAQILMKPLIWLKLFKNIRPIYDHQVAKAMVKTALIEKKIHSEIVSSGEMQDLSK